MELKSLIRDVHDFPIKGIVFKDITTLLKNSKGLKSAGDELFELAKGKNISKVVGIESRGFIPAEKLSETYTLEYGEDKIEIHKDAIEPGDKVLLHDDLLATGGTMEAAAKLIEKMGGEIVQISFLIELSFLKGREKLSSYDVHSLIQYDSE
jgi:adenine phosphoribosyltransferase